MQKAAARDNLASHLKSEFIKAFHLLKCWDSLTNRKYDDGGRKAGKGCEWKKSRHQNVTSLFHFPYEIYNVIRIEASFLRARVLFPKKMSSAKMQTIQFVKHAKLLK